MIADPYPVIDSLGALAPIVKVTFHDVEARISRLNLDDPQPPGYRYRLPLFQEYDPWVANRDLVVPEEAYTPWGGRIDPTLVTPTPQGVGYYELGLWFHVGGSVRSWCCDPLTRGGDRIIRGGSWFSDVCGVRTALLDWIDPGGSIGDLGYRLVRGAVL